MQPLDEKAAYLVWATTGASPRRSFRAGPFGPMVQPQFFLKMLQPEAEVTGE